MNKKEFFNYTVSNSTLKTCGEFPGGLLDCEPRVVAAI